MSVLLKVRNLSKSYGGVQAVKDVSFELARGELLAMIGPNGAGKSTCFNMLNGQIRPNGGQVMINGIETVGFSPSQVWRLGVGRTFQIAATFLSMTVCENVQTALISHRDGFGLTSFFGVARDRYRTEALDVLEVIGMRGHAERACGELAYGDVKRLELAIALANEPKLLLMDEPAAGMAPQERIRLMALTADIAKRLDIGVLFTEHDMDVVFEHADRLMVLNRGQVIMNGTPTEVRNDPQVRAVYLGEGLVYSGEHA